MGLWEGGLKRGWVDVSVGWREGGLRGGMGLEKGRLDGKKWIERRVG